MTTKKLPISNNENNTHTIYDIFTVCEKEIYIHTTYKKTSIVQNFQTHREIVNINISNLTEEEIKEGEELILSSFNNKERKQSNITTLTLNTDGFLSIVIWKNYFIFSKNIIINNELFALKHFYKIPLNKNFNKNFEKNFYNNYKKIKDKITRLAEYCYENQDFISNIQKYKLINIILIIYLNFFQNITIKKLSTNYIELIDIHTAFSIDIFKKRIINTFDFKKLKEIQSIFNNKLKLRDSLKFLKQIQKTYKSIGDKIKENDKLNYANTSNNLFIDIAPVPKIKINFSRDEHFLIFHQKKSKTNLTKCFDKFPESMFGTKTIKVLNNFYNSNIKKEIIQKTILASHINVERKIDFIGLNGFILFFVKDYNKLTFIVSTKLLKNTINTDPNFYYYEQSNNIDLNEIFKNMLIEYEFDLNNLNFNTIIFPHLISKKLEYNNKQEQIDIYLKIKSKIFNGKKISNIVFSFILQDKRFFKSKKIDYENYENINDIIQNEIEIILNQLKQAKKLIDTHKLLKKFKFKKNTSINLNAYNDYIRYNKYYFKNINNNKVNILRNLIKTNKIGNINDEILNYSKKNPTNSIYLEESIDINSISKLELKKIFHQNIKLRITNKFYLDGNDLLNVFMGSKYIDNNYIETIMNCWRIYCLEQL